MAFGPRQSYARVGKYALIAHQRYAHAKQFKRANLAPRGLAENDLGRRYARHHAQDQGRRGEAGVCLRPIAVAGPCWVRHQRQRQRGHEGLFAARARRSSASAKARRISPYEFGVKGGFRREVQPRRQHWFLNEKSGFPFRTPAFCSVSRGQRRLGEKEYRAPSVTPGVALRPRTQAGLARHHAPSLQGRPVHCPRQGAAGATLMPGIRWPP